MAGVKVICPRCDCNKARANAKGPDVIWCPKCNGFVDVSDRDGPAGAYCDDPVTNLIAKEERIEEQGRVLERRGVQRELLGGLDTVESKNSANDRDSRRRVVRRS